MRGFKGGGGGQLLGHTKEEKRSNCKAGSAVTVSGSMLIPQVRFATSFQGIGSRE
jgi:hypothetical protein